MTFPSRVKQHRKMLRSLASPTEHVEQAMLFQWSEHASGRHPELRDMYAIPNAGGYSGGFKRNMLRVVAMKREGVRSGVPDIHLPHARGMWHSLYIELKRQGARPSDTKPEQRDWHARLLAAGHRVEVCNGWEAARDAILNYLDGGCK